MGAAIAGGCYNQTLDYFSPTWRHPTMMECLIPFVLIVVVIAIVVGVSGQAGATSNRLNQSFYALAQRYRGTSTSGGWSSRPTCAFPYGSTYVQVRSVKAGWFSSPTLEITLSYPDTLFECEVFPTHSAYASNRLDIRVGNAFFDNYYTVAGRDHEAIRRFLSDGVQWHIHGITQLGGTGASRLVIRNGLLFIQKDIEGDSYAQLEELVQSSIGLLEQALMTREEGIVLEEEAASGPPDCPVCGDSILDDLVYCRRCGTPHHRECWSYVGRCSVYGCGSAEFAYPDPAHPRLGSPSAGARAPSR